MQRPGFRAHTLRDITVRNNVRGGRRNIRAGQEEAHCRSISYKEREKIWRDAVEREASSRKKAVRMAILARRVWPCSTASSLISST